MDRRLDPANPRDANLRAALASALQGLLRSQEFCLNKSNENRSIDSLPMRIDLVELTPERMVTMFQPCKNMHHLGGKTCPLPIGAGGELVDAVAEMHNLLRVDPTPSGHAHSTPLFRDPATGGPLTYETVLQVTRELMASIGEDPTQFGTHSYRIGGATALFASGANETVIRTMGRWSSDIHRLYVRACFEHVCEWTARAGSAAPNTIEGHVFDDIEEVDDY